MSELKRLMKAYDDQKCHHRYFALATVVTVYGSSYRRPGARMLISHDGQITGTISGGCLEGDALKRARYIMLKNQADVIIYDSTDRNEDLSFGAQLGCQGKIEIFIEPVDALDPENVLETLRKAIRLNEPVIFAYVISAERAGKPRSAIFSAADLTGRDTSSMLSGIDPEMLSAANTLLLDDMRWVLESGSPMNKNYTLNNKSCRVFIQLLRPTPRLSIYGAGNDVQPLSRMASGMGWDVFIVDGRLAQAKSVRFPEAESVQVVAVDEFVGFTPQAGYAVLMSHNYNYDLAVLDILYMRDDISYIGILGPRQKTNFLLNDLTKNRLLQTSFLTKVHGPVGLDLGAETPEEIALSVMAELLALEKGHSGNALKLLDRPIHHRHADRAQQNLETPACLVAE